MSVKTVHPSSKQAQITRITAIVEDIFKQYPEFLLSAYRVSRRASYGPYMRLMVHMGSLDSSYLGEADVQRKKAGTAFIWLMYLAIISNVDHVAAVKNGLSMDPLSFEVTTGVASPDVGNTLVIMGHLAESLAVHKSDRTQILVEAMIHILSSYAFGELVHGVEAAWAEMKEVRHV